MKKGLLIGCGSVFGLFLLIGACMADIGDDKKNPVANPSPSVEEPSTQPVEDTEETTVPEPQVPEPVVFEGKDDKATDTLLIEGFVTIEATHQGSSNFVVRMLDQSGNSVKLFVNEIGKYKGKTFCIHTSR